MRSLLFSSLALIIVVSIASFEPVVGDIVHINRFAIENLSVYFSSKHDSTFVRTEASAIISIETSAREEALQGALALQKGRLEQAIADLNEAILLSGGSGRSDIWRLQLAQAYLAAGRKEDARQLITQISGFRQKSFTRCMTFLWWRPDIEAAGLWCPLLEEGKSLTAQEECWSLGVYYLLTYQRDAAEVVFARASAKSGMGVDCIRYFADSYYHRYNDFSQASRYSRLAIASDPNVDIYVYWLLAASERQLQHHDAAVDAYWMMEQQLSGSTDHPEWRHEFATYLLELKRDGEALKAYRSILQDIPNDQTAKEAIDLLVKK